MIESKSYLLISVDESDYDQVSDILMTFSEQGYFDNEDVEVSYDAVTKEHIIDISNVRSCRTAALIGDILEASLGKVVQWFHYAEDPEDDDWEDE